MTELEQRLQFAVELAEEAGAVTLEYFLQENYEVERKGDNSPVTQADRSAEQRMRERIADQFPQDGILGEEFGEASGASGYRWILDPIDGTKSFITGVPLYTVLIGVMQGEQSKLGVIHVPALRETVYAGQGAGAWWKRADGQPRPARVSTRPLSSGVFLTSQVDSFGGRSADDAYRRLEQSAYITRTWGDGYGYLLVATGRAEVIVDPEMSLWDAAALQPVLEEAGGAFTDWQGQPTVLNNEGVGCSASVQQDVLTITRAFPRPS